MSEPVRDARDGPLDYATPFPLKRFAVGSLIAFVAATILVSAGCGLITFGALTANRFRDDEAAFVAFGVALVVMGTGVVASWLFVKRH